MASGPSHRDIHPHGTTRRESYAISTTIPADTVLTNVFVATDCTVGQ